MSILLTKSNIELSLLSELSNIVDSEINLIKGKSSKNVFISVPDFQKQDTTYPVVIATLQSKLERAVGMGKIGHGGKRQTLHTYNALIGTAARTSAEISRIEELITFRFSNRHFLDIYNFDERGIRQELVGRCRIKLAESDFSPGDSTASSKVNLLSYVITAYKTLE